MTNIRDIIEVKKYELMSVYGGKWDVDNDPVKDWCGIECTYSDSLLNGYELSYKDISLAIGKNLTNGTKRLSDYRGIGKYKDAFDMVYHKAHIKYNMDEKLIASIYKRLRDRDYSKVQYRTCPTGGRTIPYTQVPSAMHNFVEQMKKDGYGLDSAFDAYYKILTIAPFEKYIDRLARLVMDYILIWSGYMPVILRVRDIRHYEGFKERLKVAHTEDDMKETKEAFKNFIFTLISRAYDRILHDFSGKVLQKQGLLTISKFSKLTGVPITTIRYYISKGEFAPVTRTKADYMLFSPDQAAELQKLKKR